IEIVKDVVSPFATDAGRFNLVADSITRLANAYDVNMTAGTSADDPAVTGIQNTTGQFKVQVGTSQQANPSRTIAIAETAGASTSLSDYTSSITCVDTGSNQVVAGPTAATTLNLNAAADKSYRCTITHTRKTATIKLVKDFQGTIGNAMVDLTLGGNVVANDLTADGQSAVIPVLPGSFTVAEAFVAGNASDFSTSVSCTNATSTTGSGLSRTVVVPVNANVVCTFTNVRNAAQLKIIKIVQGPANTGNTSWSFAVTGPSPSTQLLSVTGLNQASTSFLPVDTGTYSIVESGASGTDASLFNTTVACAGADNAGTVGGGGKSISNLIIGTGDQVTCTFTNTRKQAKLEVKKSYPAQGADRFTLQILDQPASSTIDEATNQTNGGSTGENILPTGAYTVRELGFGSTSLANYNTTLACVLDGTSTPVTATPGVNNQVGT
ncbi:MAG: hypothetical protein ACRC1H_15370, partial [Caldilineaceae bacterium]